MPKLAPNPNNPRTISKEAFEQLKGKIQRNPDGLSANKIVYKDGIIIAGNQRWRAIQDLKLEVKDDWLKDVSGWTDEQIREYLVTSNISDGDWDWDVLLNEYDPQELDDWGLETPGLEDDKEIVEDEAPEVDDANPPVSVLGEVYQLGRHRLMCGSATELADVEKLMDGKKADMVFTDPPYGMHLDTAMSERQTVKGDWISKPKKYDHVIGDHDDFTPELITTILDNFSYCKEMFVFGADYFAELLPKKNDGSWVVWDKRAGVEDMKWSTSEFELCWSKTRHQRKIARITWSGILGTEQEHDHDSGRVHPTQKPVRLVSWFFENWGSGSDAVVDLYGGSGSTLLGCEQTDRTCYMMELDPKYVDVIRKRYAKFIQPDNQLPENWEELTPAIN